jgi:MFS family permease
MEGQMAERALGRVSWETRVRSATQDYYLIYLMVLAVAGWTLSSYDFNLLVNNMPNIAADLHLSATLVGLLGFIIYASMFVITLFVGYGMDTIGRKAMWQWCLVGTAVFTGLTYFVQNFGELALTRCVASGFGIAELSIAVTLVNEQVPAKVRGFLYSVVQGGWPLGVFLSSFVYLHTIQFGWRVVFAFGVIPLVAVIVGRLFIRESPRFEHLREVKRALRGRQQQLAEQLLDRYRVDLDEAQKVTVRQIFATPGYVRRQLSLLTVVWLCYASSWVATNVYITYWLVEYRHWTAIEASTLLLVSSGIGYFFYLIGGLLGEFFGRREVLILTGALTAPLNLLFLFVHGTGWPIWLLYFFIYQATNGTWSGAGYAYWGESFPTRCRGTAVGWLGSMFALGLIIGTGIWTGLIGPFGPVTTWVVVAVVLAVGEYLTFFLRRIPPHQELEAIAV